MTTDHFDTAFRETALSQAEALATRGDAALTPHQALGAGGPPLRHNRGSASAIEAKAMTDSQDFQRIIVTEVSHSEFDLLREVREAREKQEAAEAAAQPALQRLFKIAQGHSGQCRHVAAFLLGLYNGQRFRYDMTNFRAVDEEIFEDMMLVLRMDSRPRREVHNYLPGGSGAFEALANDWNLHKSQWEVSENGSFAKQINGYLCFIQPVVEDGRLWWRWFIQSGGGWAWRGGDTVTQHADGKEYSPRYAEQSIEEWFERGGENPIED